MRGARWALEVARLKALRPEEAAKDCLRHRDVRYQPGLRGRSAQPGDKNSSGAQGRLEESGFQGPGT